MGLLLLVHLGSGFLHPCCLAGAAGAAEESTPHGDHGVPDAAPDVTDAGMAHHGPVSPSSGDEQDNDCEGSCGLCCSTVDQIALVTAPVAPARVQEAIQIERSRLYAAELPPTPEFLLPFANGPPGSPPLLS